MSEPRKRLASKFPRPEGDQPPESEPFAQGEWRRRWRLALVAESLDALEDAADSRPDDAPVPAMELIVRIVGGEYLEGSADSGGIFAALFSGRRF